MGDLMADIGTILPILKDILQDVHKLTSDQITDIATNVDKLIETNSITLERLLNRVDHIAANIENVTSSEAGDAKVAIKNVRDITESIKTLVGSSEGEVKSTGTAVRGSLAKLQTTVDNLDKTLHNMESDHLAPGQGAGHGGAPADRRHHRQQRRGDHRGRRQLRPRHHQAADHRRAARRVQLPLAHDQGVPLGQLVPRPDKFYLIELVEDPRGFREETSQVTNSSRNGVELVDHGQRPRRSSASR